MFQDVYSYIWKAEKVYFILNRLLRGRTDPLADSCSLCYLEDSLTKDTYTGQSRVDKAASPYSCASPALAKERTPPQTGGSRLIWKYFMRRMD